MKLTKTLLIAFLTQILLTTVCNFELKAQKLHPKVLDTVVMHGKEIVLFSNNTWQEVVKKVPLDFTVHETDTMKVFKESWSNSLLFPYRSSGVGGSACIVLVDSVHKFVHPNPNAIIGEYKQRRREFHAAWDIALLPGTPVRSAFDGKVRFAEYNRGGFGYLVIIRHFNGLETYYAHLSKIEVKPNELVKAGQIIGLGGNTGRASAFHLHFEIRYRDKALNPNLIIDPRTYKLKTDTLYVGQARPNFEPMALVEQSPQVQQQVEKEDKPVLKETAQKKQNTGAKKYHTVKSGETLSAISRKYGVSVKDICRLNGIKETSLLQLGKKLRVK